MTGISLQNTVIAAGIALAVGGIAGSLTAWSLTKNHYVAVIETERSAASEAARVAELKLNTTVANLNSDSRKVLDQVSSAFQEKLNAAEAINSDFRTRIANGTLVLRDPGASRSSQVSKDRGGSAASSGDGQTGGELSPAATRFLWGEAERADANTEQLKACQDVVTAYWTTINKYGLEIEALTLSMSKK